MTINIALEGIDNCGKTTTAHELVEFLNSNGFSAVCSKEFESPYGKILKEKFYRKSKCPTANEKVLAFALDRLIRYEALNSDEYDIVVWDRYVLSAIVYRSVEGIDPAWVNSVNAVFKMPDLYYFIDILPDVAINRGKASQKECPYNQDFLKKCREEYLKHVNSGCLRLLNGESTKDNVTEIFNAINKIKK